MAISRFAPIQEFWKYDGVNWQILQNGEQFDVDSAHIYCLNCFYELDDSIKCQECGQQHKMSGAKTAVANRAAKSLQASKRRNSYTVMAPQIGEKIADVDLELSSNRFMNVKLEKRKQNEQVVITVGDRGESKKAQVFVDLNKSELRHDARDDDPANYLESVKLDSGGRSTEKKYHSTTNEETGPYIFLQLNSFGSDGHIKFTAYSYENVPYHLERIEIGNSAVDVDRNIEPNGKTESISTYGLSVPPFEEEEPGLYITVNRGRDSWRIFQEFQLGTRADGKFNLHKIVEKPASYEKLN